MIDLGEYTNEILNRYKVKDHPTGSNYICNPPVTDTDIDWIILLSNDHWNAFGRMRTELEELGWNFQFDPKYSNEIDDFRSARRQNINLLFVGTEETFNKWVEATEEAKKLNLTNKQDRINLFEKVCRSRDTVDSRTEENLEFPFYSFTTAGAHTYTTGAFVPHYLMYDDFSPYIRVKPVTTRPAELPKKDLKKDKFGTKLRSINNKMKKKLVEKNSFLGKIMGLMR